MSGGPVPHCPAHTRTCAMPAFRLAAAAGVNVEMLHFKILEAAIDVLLDHAFVNTGLLPVIVAHVRAELSRIMQYDLGVKFDLTTVDKSVLFTKINSELQTRSVALYHAADCHPPSMPGHQCPMYA